MRNQPHRKLSVSTMTASQTAETPPKMKKRLSATTCGDRERMIRVRVLPTDVCGMRSSYARA